MSAPAPRQPLRRALMVLALAAVLGLTLSLYLRPDFMVMMADAVWACF